MMRNSVYCWSGEKYSVLIQRDNKQISLASSKIVSPFAIKQYPPSVDPKHFPPLNLDSFWKARSDEIGHTTVEFQTNKSTNEDVRYSEREIDRENERIHSTQVP